MTEKQEARLIKKSNRIRQKIIEIELTIKENKLKGLDYMNFANQNEIEKLETENKKYIEKLHNFNHPVGGIHSEPFIMILCLGLSILLLIHMHVPDNW